MSSPGRERTRAVVVTVGLMAVFVVVLVAAAGWFLARVVFGDADGSQQVATALRDSFAAGAAADEPVALGEVVDGEWRRLIVVCPYEDQSVVDELLGFHWDDFPGPDGTESRAYFLFADQAEVVAWTRLARSEGDPCGGIPAELSRRDAVVTVAPARGQPEFLTLDLVAEPTGR